MYSSTTGLNRLMNGIQPILIFFDNTCPICTNKLSPLLRDGIYVRYYCQQCKFVCPIYHNPQNPQIMRPLYDSSIFNFINSFGEPIHEFRKRMVTVNEDYIL